MFEENPFKRFEKWLFEAGYKLQNGFIIPDLPVVLATSFHNIPSARVVYLKKLIMQEFIFFTNVNSKKGREIKINSNVSVCVFFEKLGRQVRIEGKSLLADIEHAQEYFMKRPLIAKAASALSRQSEVLHNYDDFVKEVYEQSVNSSENFKDKVPANWAGFKIEPSEFEFFEGREFRLNKRESYKKDLHSEKLWNVVKLYP